MFANISLADVRRDIGLDDFRRDIRAGQAPLTKEELATLDANELRIYEDTEYQYHQEMRVKWEFFYNDVFYLDQEVKKLIQARQLAFCQRNQTERDEVLYL